RDPRTVTRRAPRRRRTRTEPPAARLAERRQRGEAMLPTDPPGGGPPSGGSPKPDGAPPTGGAPMKARDLPLGELLEHIEGTLHPGSDATREPIRLGRLRSPSHRPAADAVVVLGEGDDVPALVASWQGDLPGLL